MRFDVSQIWRTVQSMINGFVATLPRLALALIVVGVFVLVARGVRSLVRRHANRSGHERTLEIALGRLAQAGILLLGVLIAVTAAFPTFTPGDLVGALGIGGVAIGFAFKDIFQNFLAGLLILITRPFRVGDQIIFKDYEGTVESIQTRATLLTTYDGRRVIIPNGELYTNSVTVNTAFETRRSQYDIGIGYGDDIELAKRIILEVINDAEGVLADPQADVIVVEFAESSVNLRARWWSASRQVDVLIAKDKVLVEAKRRLEAVGIQVPYPTRQLLFQYQSDSADGDRRQQREERPAGRGDVPEPRSLADAVQAAARREPAASNGDTPGRQPSDQTPADRAPATP